MALKEQFDTAMMDIYHRARAEVGYIPPPPSCKCFSVTVGC